MGRLETRKKILDSAEKLFSENGFDGVPTKLIAKEAGISEMTLFNYFESKKLLYKTVIEEKYHSTEITSVYNKLTYIELEKDLTIITKKIVETFHENVPVLQMQLKEKLNFRKDIDFKTKNDPVFKQLLPVFKKFSENKMIRMNSEKAIVMYMTTLKGLLHTCMIEDKSRDEVQSLTTLYVSIFCNGICNEG